MTLPTWMLRMVWKFRRKRAVRVHFRPTTGEDRSIEGALLGRWGGHYVLAGCHVIAGPDDSLAIEGIAEIPAETVLFLQVLA